MWTCKQFHFPNSIPIFVLYLVTLTLTLTVASIVAASRTLSGQTEVLIDDELARDGVAGSAESEANDDS
jgi:hypothetical protein